MHFTRYLGFKVFLLLLCLMAVSFSSYAFLTITLYHEHLMENVRLSALRGSDLIKRSLRYSMLKNRTEDIYQMIRTLGNEEGVDGIRIYDKSGAIRFSTVDEEKGTIVDMRAEACNLCHLGGAVIESPSPEEKVRVYRSSEGYRVLGLINPIENEPDCYDNECHAHPSNRQILGVLDVKMSLESVDRGVASGRRNMIYYGMLVVLSIAVMIGIFIWRAVNVPIRKLIEGTGEISRGNLGHTIDLSSHDEIGMLAMSFNRMSEELKKTNDEIVEWSRSFEKKLEEKTREIGNARERLIEAEKMASIGTLAATVAHEINNPLGGILTYTKVLLRAFMKSGTRSEDDQTVAILSTIENEAKRCGRIVENMLLLVRKPVREYASHDLHSIIEKSLLLIDHHLQVHGVRLEKVFGNDVGCLMCDENQLHQAFVAIMINAIEAMPDGGTLKIETRTKNSGHVQVSFIDSGVGIRQEDTSRIFEPFFTTKREGRVVGLGLSVVYGIIKGHGGSIRVNSTPGVGTVFTLTLPRIPVMDAEAVLH